MLYRRFGRTELAMPIFSCGGMRYQYKWQDVPDTEIPPDNQENLAKIIFRAFDLGINHIETARGYGTSEMQLGKVLPQLPREKLIVQTKASPQPDSGEFKRTFEQSLRYLQLDYVDLFSLHGINTPELLEESIRPGGCLDVAKQLQQEGKVRFIGFSTHGPTDVIIKTIQTNQFDYVNLHWYYINQLNWQAILTAKTYDLGVFIISPSDKGGQLYQPPQKLVDLCYPLSPMVFNNLFCLSHPEVHTLSLGAAKPTDFDEHLKTIPLLGAHSLAPETGAGSHPLLGARSLAPETGAGSHPLLGARPLLEDATDILPSIIQRLEAEAIARLGKDWYETWNVGLPTPETTPGSVNIPVILWLYNLAIAYDLVEYGKMRYNLLGNASHWFPGAKADRIDQLDLTDCLSQSPHRGKIPAILAKADELLGGTTVKRLSQS